MVGHRHVSTEIFRVSDPAAFSAVARLWPVEIHWVDEDSLYIGQHDDEPWGGWRAPDDAAEGFPWTAIAQHLPPGEIATFYQCGCEDYDSDGCGSAVAIDSEGRTVWIELQQTIAELAREQGLGRVVGAEAGSASPTDGGCPAGADDAEVAGDMTVPTHLTGISA